METETKMCPRCKREIDAYPALSRRDNQTDICSECGKEEAMIDMAMGDIPPVLRKEIEFGRRLIKILLAEQGKLK